MKEGSFDAEVGCRLWEVFEGWYVLFFSSLVGLTHAKAPVMMAAQQKAIA